MQQSQIVANRDVSNTFPRSNTDGESINKLYGDVRNMLHGVVGG